MSHRDYKPLPESPVEAEKPAFDPFNVRPEDVTYVLKKAEFIKKSVQPPLTSEFLKSHYEALNKLSPSLLFSPKDFQMTEDQRLLAMWAAINSALYLAAIIGVAVVLGKPLAWQLAIFTYGVCYLSYAVQMWYPGTMIAKALTFLSIATGTGAGLALLW